MTFKPTVLVCDSDVHALRSVHVVLEAAGFHVQPARTAREALEHAGLRAFEVVVTEIVLPDDGGVEVCRRLRQATNAALLVLSSVGTERTKVLALEAGADDFLMKPLRGRELVARLHAVLRRPRPGAPQSSVRLHGLTFDVRACVVRHDGLEVRLSPTEFELLRTLAHNRGQVLTYAHLRRHASRRMTPQACRTTLRVQIRNLRGKLARIGQSQLIHTHPGIGYRFEEPDPIVASQPTAR